MNPIDKLKCPCPNCGGNMVEDYQTAETAMFYCPICFTHHYAAPVDPDTCHKTEKIYDAEGKEIRSRPPVEPSITPEKLYKKQAECRSGDKSTLSEPSKSARMLLNLPEALPETLPQNTDPNPTEHLERLLTDMPARQNEAIRNLKGQQKSIDEIAAYLGLDIKRVLYVLNLDSGLQAGREHQK